MRLHTTTLIAASVMGVLYALPANADVLAFNGFETGVGDWTTDPYPGSVTQTPSGGGPLGVTAYDGNYYGTVQTSNDTYETGFGYGGYSYFGFDTVAPPYPGSSFTQSTAVYIDVNTPSNPSTPAFWVDNMPSSTSAYDQANTGGLGYGGEHNFRLTYTGSSVVVTDDGNITPSAVITQSGWYLFDFTYGMGPTPTSLSTTDLSLLTGSGQLLSSDLFTNNSDGDPLESQDLAGPGLDWLTVWQDNFSNDFLAIDDAQAYTGGPAAAAAVPEPMTLLLFAAGLGGLGLMLRRRKRAAALS